MEHRDGEKLINYTIINSYGDLGNKNCHTIINKKGA
jgi:hypothetical protein